MEEKKMIVTRGYETPCGRLLLGSYEDHLCLCDWQVEPHCTRVAMRLQRMLDAEFVDGPSEVLDRAVAELDEYFAGARRQFDMPLLFVGTDFQKAVWDALLSIPYGETVSYGDVARRLGLPKGVRAVANAIGANAVSVVVPCHRVVGASGSPTGYAGGLPAKTYLIHLEAGKNFG